MAKKKKREKLSPGKFLEYYFFDSFLQKFWINFELDKWLKENEGVNADTNVVVGMTGELEYQGAWHVFEVAEVRNQAHPHLVTYSSEPMWTSEWLTLDSRTNQWGKRGFFPGKMRFVQFPVTCFHYRHKS